jgi:hypothetical protein
MTRTLTAVVVGAQLVASVLFAAPGWAQDRDRLLGNWRLVSYVTEDVETKQRNNVYGERPTGFIGFTPAGRFFAVVSADGRKPPQTTDEQAAAFRSMIAYTGQYRLDGERFITKVDVAWNEAWTGTEQVRFWRVDGDRLFITSAPIPNPNVPGGRMIGILEWARE